MENIVNVEGTELAVREYNGQMVVTFDDIDLVHKRPHGTARNAFKRNKRHFIDGVDYFVLEKENSNVHETYIRNIDIPNRGITVFTESGYLMLVKPFKDDLSWDVQRALVNGYFSSKNQQPNTAILEKRYFPEDTDWFRTNEWKIRYYCEYVGITKKVFMHVLLKVIGRKYYFDGARKRYIEETGNLKPTNSEVISYFDNIREEADKCLNNAYNVALNGEHKEKDPD